MLGTTPLGEPEALVQGFNQHGPVTVVFTSDHADLSQEFALPDTVELSIAGGWTAEQVVYGPPRSPTCPNTGDRLEIHGLLEVHSAAGLDFEVPVLLSSTSDEVGDSSLVLWSADVDTGRAELPNPLISLSSTYETAADEMIEGPDLLGLYLGTENELAGSLDAGGSIMLAAYNEDGSRTWGFLKTSFVW